MNATMFWRILWKEYRAQRAFWISMIVLTPLVQALLRLSYRLYHSGAPAQEPVHVLFAVGMMFAAIYALGSGATLFASERETETYDFLRGLPVKPLLVFAAKVVFALASTTVVFLLAWTAALALVHKLPVAPIHGEIWALFGLGGVELLAWGILFSLLLKRPLVAIVCAATASSIVIGTLNSNLEGWRPFADLKSQPFVRLLIVAIVTAADIALATRWFRERLLFSARLQRQRSHEASDLDMDRPPSPATMLGRLVWQEFRASAAMSAALVAMPLLLLLLFSAGPWLRARQPTGSWFDIFMSVGVIAAALSAPLLGSTVFLADQTGCRFRFLAERGMPPRLVWLSRQIRGSSIMLLGMLLALLVWLPTLARLYEKNDIGNLVAVVGNCAGFVLAAYACGQLFSMVFRSGVLAMTFGTVLTYLLCGWAAIMYWFGLSWLWTVAPLLLAMLVATWLHAPNWLLERETRWARLPPALVIAVPALAILVAIPPVRIYEIPLVGPGFDVAELTRPISPQEQETLTLYNRAAGLLYKDMPQPPPGSRVIMLPGPDTPARRKAEEQALALAMEASRRPLPEAYSAPGAMPDPGAEFDLADFVFASGKRLQAEGKLDAALERYLAADRIAMHAGPRAQAFDRVQGQEIEVCRELVHWAAQRGQNSQRVLEALRAVEKQWRNPPLYSDCLKHRYLGNLGYIEGSYFIAAGNAPFLVGWTRTFPWERTRAVRLLNKLTAEEFARYTAAEEDLAAGRAVAAPTEAFDWPQFERDVADAIVRSMVKSYNVENVHGRNVNVGSLGECLMGETCRRATRLVLALEAWKLEHGGLPKSLNDLKGKYLHEVPVDPYFGEEFVYEPKGIPEYLVSFTWFSDDRTLEPDRPFLACDTWSGSGAGWLKQVEESNTEWRRMLQARAAAGHPETEVWHRVWVFPIP